MSKSQDSALLHSVAGSLAGVTSLFLTYPLLTVATRMQVQKREKSSAAVRYANAADCLLKILEAEGLLKLYSGCKTALVGTAFAQATYYFCYQRGKNFIRKIFFGVLSCEGDLVVETRAFSKRFPGIANLVVAWQAGVITAVITRPIWVVTTNMQAHKGLFQMNPLAQRF